MFRICVNYSWLSSCRVLIRYIKICSKLYGKGFWWLLYLSYLWNKTMWLWQNNRNSNDFAFLICEIFFVFLMLFLFYKMWIKPSMFCYNVMLIWGHGLIGLNARLNATKMDQVWILDQRQELEIVLRKWMVDLHVQERVKKNICKLRNISTYGKLASPLTWKWDAISHLRLFLPCYALPNLNEWLT